MLGRRTSAVLAAIAGALLFTTIADVVTTPALAANLRRARQSIAAKELAVLTGQGISARRAADALGVESELAESNFITNLCLLRSFCRTTRSRKALPSPPVENANCNAPLAAGVRSPLVARTTARRRATPPAPRTVTLSETH